MSSARGKVKDAVCYDAPSDHDPLCNWRQTEEADAGDPRRWLAGGLAVCDCDLITKVRADERHRFDDDGADRDIRERTIRECIEVVETYAEDTHRHVGNRLGFCMHEDGDRCDITAALHVAVQRLRALQEQP